MKRPIPKKTERLGLRIKKVTIKLSLWLRAGNVVNARDTGGQVGVSVKWFQLQARCLWHDPYNEQRFNVWQSTNDNPTTEKKYPSHPRTFPLSQCFYCCTERFCWNSMCIELLILDAERKKIRNKTWFSCVCVCVRL